MTAIDDIKARIDIVELISESGVKLRKSGRNHTGFCPFHANKNTPAFVVWQETGTWRCFGECNEGGDILKFVMKKEGVDFREALRRLADRAGVELPEFRAQPPEQKEAHAHLRKLLDDAVVFFAAQLKQNPALLGYLRDKRHLTDATIETFGLGYAPSSYDTLLKHFTTRGYSEQDLIDAGLASERQPESGPVHGPFRSFDRFRNRLMIPIRDAEGHMTGFGARIVDPIDVPKFLNSPETPLFTKGHLLYGLDRARKAIRTAEQAVIVEGYMDVIALHQAGFENVVSPMGTALTEEQLRLLKRFSRNVVLALDPDAAGQKAVLRGLEAARQAMDREDELAFDARGLLRSEAHLQADLRVASLPDGLDPDEIIARDPAEWKQAVAGAQPIIEHVMQALAKGRDLNDRKVASEISGQVLPLIRDVARPEEREFYTQKLARFLKIDERAFLSAPVAPARRRTQSAEEREQASATAMPAAPILSSARQKVEVSILAWLLNKPELLYRVDRLLQRFALDTLSGDDFESTDHQLVFGLLRDAVEQDEVDHRQFVLDRMPAALAELTRTLLAETAGATHPDDKVLEELLRSVRRLREDAANLKRTEYRYLQEQAQEQGDAEGVALYTEAVFKLVQLKRTLDEFSRKMSTERLR